MAVHALDCFWVWQNPKRFEEVYEEMIGFLEKKEHWEKTEAELATRGVRTCPTKR